MQIGLGGAVFIVFLVLKLIHKIDWSWWWVTSPIWGALALTVFMIIVGFSAVGASQRRSRKRMQKRMASSRRASFR